MEDALPRIEKRQFLIAAAGPAVLGALLQLHFGAAATVRAALQLPAICIGVTLLMLPALYIGASLVGVDLTARRIVAAAGTALSRASFALLGLAPALLFLYASIGDPFVLAIGEPLVLLLGAFIAVRFLFPTLFAQEVRARAALVFAPWVLVQLGIAARLFFQIH